MFTTFCGRHKLVLTKAAVEALDDRFSGVQTVAKSGRRGGLNNGADRCI